MLLLLAATVMLAPTPQANVDLTLRATTLRQALATIGQKAQLALSVSNDLGGEIVAIRVQDVATQDLLGRIATVAGGRWEQTDAGWRLVLDTTQQNRDRREATERRVARLRATIAELTNPTDGDRPADPGADRQAILAALGAVDVREIATLGPRARLVYASRPNRMQRPLPSVANRHIDRWVQAHNEGVAKRGPEADDSALPEEVQQMEASMPWIRAMRDRMRRPITQVGNVLMAVQPSQIGMALGHPSTEVVLKVYHADGKVALEERMELTGPGRRPEPPAGPGTPIELSPETKLLSSVNAGEGLPTVSPELMKLLKDPVAFDPLAFSATDRLFALAKKRNQPLVAVVPDTAAGLEGMNVGTVEQFEAKLAEGDPMQRVEDPAWILIRPENPIEARNGRFNRAALKNLILATERDGVPSLNSMAAYAAAQPADASQGLATYHLLFAVPGSMSITQLGGDQWDFYRLYGSFDPSSRAAVLDGRPIPLGALSPSQQAIIARMVFGVPSKVQVVRGPQQEEDLFSMLALSAQFSIDAADEPTLAFPNGITGQGALTMTLAQTYYAMPLGQGDKPFPAPLNMLGAEEVALFKMISEMPMILEAGDEMPKLDRVRVGSMDRVTIAVRLSPLHEMRSVLRDPKPLGNAPIVDMKGLPAAFAQDINARLERLKKSPFGAMGALGGVGRMAPPP